MMRHNKKAVQTVKVWPFLLYVSSTLTGPFLARF